MTAHRRMASAALIVCGVIVAAWSVIPLLWLLIVSVLPARDLAAQPPILDPGAISLEKFARLIGDSEFARALLNSLIVATSATIVCLVAGSLAAYSISRLRPPGWALVIGILVLTQMVPGIILVIPLFLMIRTFGQLDSLLALALVHSAFLLPFAIWILKTFFDDIPRAIEAAARMDGASRIGTLRHVILPMSGPGLAATAVFCFIASWNDFFLALVLTLDKAKTAPVKIAEIATTFSIAPPDVGLIAASSALMVLPVLLIVAFLNRYVVYGASQGAVKG